jgi:hypothetical protein
LENVKPCNSVNSERRGAGAARFRAVALVSAGIALFSLRFQLLTCAHASERTSRDLVVLGWRGATPVIAREEATPAVRPAAFAGAQLVIEYRLGDHARRWLDLVARRPLERARNVPAPGVSAAVELATTPLVADHQVQVIAPKPAL